MKGNAKIIELLNRQLEKEYGAIVQYTVHASMFTNWGYQKLAGYATARAKQEMGHADKLQDRILFLEGMPSVKLVNAFTGTETPEMIRLDLTGELDAREGYNELVKLCIQMGDNGTRLVVESILAEEEEHINDLEAQQKEIFDVKLPQFLAVNIEGD